MGKHFSGRHWTFTVSFFRYHSTLYNNSNAVGMFMVWCEHNLGSGAGMVFYSQLDWFWVSIWLIFSHRPGNPVFVPPPLQDKKKRGDQWDSNDNKFVKSEKQRDRKSKKKEKKSRKGTPAHINFSIQPKFFLPLIGPTLKSVCQAVTLGWPLIFGPGSRRIATACSSGIYCQVEGCSGGSSPCGGALRRCLKRSERAQAFFQN